jgi:hypothetical protein
VIDTCIGEPISWLRLEQFALDSHDAHVGEHVARCAVCRQCLEQIRGDIIALPPLLPASSPVAHKRRWWMFALPAFAVAAAALLLFMRPRDRSDDAIARIKGVGDVVLGIVRERAGVIREDVRSFAPGDRFKVVVTCPPSGLVWIDVAVVEEGAVTADYPLAAAPVACGNRVVVPGAFTLTGARANRVCVRVDASAAPRRLVPHPGDENVACVTIRPD